MPVDDRPSAVPAARAEVGVRGGNRHQLAVYASVDELVAIAGPYLREGLAQGEHVVAATGAALREGLRDDLGADADAVHFADVDQWYRGLVLPAAEHSVSPPRAPLRLIGEPPLGSLPGVGRREWMRCEAATNLALAWVPGRIMCAYDFSRFEDGTVAALLATHEAIRDGESTRPNPHYVDPRDFAASSDRTALTPPPESALEFRFDIRSYAQTRRFAAEYAVKAGLTDQQECDLSLAVTELATNAVRHGGGTGHFRVWTEGPALVCEVSDWGQGMRDPLAGYIQPRAGTATSGWGMWLVRRACDVVEVRTGPTGTTVRVRVTPLAPSSAERAHRPARPC